MSTALYFFWIAIDGEFLSFGSEWYAEFNSGGIVEYTIDTKQYENGTHLLTGLFFGKSGYFEKSYILYICNNDDAEDDDMHIGGAIECRPIYSFSNMHFSINYNVKLRCDFDYNAIDSDNHKIRQNSTNDYGVLALESYALGNKPLTLQTKYTTMESLRRVRDLKKNSDLFFTFIELNNSGLVNDTVYRGFRSNDKRQLRESIDVVYSPSITISLSDIAQNAYAKHSRLYYGHDPYDCALYQNKLEALSKFIEDRKKSFPENPWKKQ